MSRSLPSQVALRSFEAAARHLSFTRAAEELFVSQSAVSHQVRGLENELGVRLFLRLTRQLRLTDAGEALLMVLRESFDRIEATVSDLKAGSEAHPLRISMTSYFAARWLTRRLSIFSAQYPNVEMSLHLINGDVDFKRMELDLAIVWGIGGWPQLESELLMPIQITAVCSPGLLKTGPPLNTIADLKSYRLLHEAGQKLWEAWFAATENGSLKTEQQMVMDDPNVLHQAALEGQGIALGAKALLEDELSRGVLVQPFKQTLELGGYYIVHPIAARERPNVSAFCNWLKTQAKDVELN